MIENIDKIQKSIAQIEAQLKDMYSNLVMPYITENTISRSWASPNQISGLYITSSDFRDCPKDIEILETDDYIWEFYLYVDPDFDDDRQWDASINYRIKDKLTNKYLKF